MVKVHTLFRQLALVALMGGAELTAYASAAAPPPLRDKTLVVWAAPANLTQRGGSALTIDDGRSHFGAIVFGELSPHKWMAGSEGFTRTCREQQTWPEETADTNTFVQIAIVYRGTQVSTYRDGRLYTRYTMADPPQEFGGDAVVLFGRRHLDVGDPQQSFTGRIKDARIYDRPLDRETVAALAPGKISEGPSPWAWWSFGDEGLRDKSGRFNEIKLLGDVRIEGGCLVLGGQGATVINSSLGDPGSRPAVPSDWSFTSPVPDSVVRSTRLLRERFLADPYRPGRSFLP